MLEEMFVCVSSMSAETSYGTSPLNECGRRRETLQETHQSTAMFMTLKLVVKDHNDYTYFSYNGRLVTDTYLFRT